ncbi:MAG: GH25 family lysozyme [Actinomycetaceae bacterium]|nr:GH25 family lysozyme [Actinomycetaceae bacterium]
MTAINTEAVVNYARSMIGQPGYNGLCEKFVRDMYGFPRAYASAKEAYRASAASGPIHKDYDAPPGVPVFWDLTGPNAAYGHVALSIGDGWAISTSDERGKPGICAISIRRYSRSAAAYLGWAEIYHGHRVYAADERVATAPAGPTGRGPLNGVDVHARYQAGLRAANLLGVSFVITKCTGGTGLVVNGWQNMLDGAALTGVYHYARERGQAGSPAQEAANFIAQARKAPTDALLVLDWEESHATNLADADWILEWMRTVEAALGRRPIFYTYQSVLAAHPALARVQQAGYALWLARYPYNTAVGWKQWDAPTVPYWGRPIMWQYSSAGGVPGWPGALDLNIFYGDATDWRALAGTPTTRHETEELDMFIVSREGDEAAYLVTGTSMRQIDFAQAQALTAADVPVKRLDPQKVLDLQRAINEAADYEATTQQAYANHRSQQAAK